MASADRDRFDRTNDLLDAHTAAARAGERGQPPMRDPDPILADTLRRLRALDAAESLDQARVARMWDALIREAAPERHGRAASSDAGAPSLNGRARAQLMPWPSARDLERQPRPHRERVWLAAAALLVLALAVGYLLFGLDRSGGTPPKSVPASVQTAVPTATLPAGVTSEETLVDLEVPASALPAGVGGSALAHMTIPPRSSTRWSVPQNVNLFFLLSGNLTVRPDAPAQLQRAGERVWQTTAAGTEITLGPGDALVLLDPGTGNSTTRGRSRSN